MYYYAKSSHTFCVIDPRAIQASMSTIHVMYLTQVSQCAVTHTYLLLTDLIQNTCTMGLILATSLKNLPIFREEKRSEREREIRKKVEVLHLSLLFLGRSIATS